LHPEKAGSKLTRFTPAFAGEAAFPTGLEDWQIKL
jgi:hypothetical protein